MNFYNIMLCRPRAGMAKILLAMKLIIVLLTTAILQVSASSYGQNVTLKQNNASLVSVFTEIRKQTGYDFFYSDKMMDSARPISINLKNATLEQALTQIFESQPLKYELKNNAVLVTAKQPSFLDKASVILNSFQDLDVRGVVVDGESGLALVGASVRVKGSGKATTTGSDGAFYLPGVDEKDMIVVSFIGYMTQELKVKKDLGEIRLVMASAELNEVTINKGYYITRKELNTGNASVVSREAIERQPVSDPLAALQGQVSGLQITQAMGAPGREYTVRIRGRNSIANGNDPLFIVDGVPFNSTPLNSLRSTNGASSYANPLNEISTADIENITVLKDADATAIYGSRGANGVILITTKRGKSGTTNFSFDAYLGAGKANKLELLNTPEYIEMRNTAFKNDNAVPAAADYDVNGTWDQNKYTDWQDVMIGNTAQIAQLQSAISGGNKLTQFRIGGGFRKEETVFAGDNYNKKVNTLVALNHRSENNKFNIEFSGTYNQNKTKLPFEDLTKFIFLAPNAPDLFDAEGNLNWENNTFINPLSLIVRRYTESTHTLISNSNITYELLPGLIAKSAFGYTRTSLEQKTVSPFKASNPNTLNPATARSSRLTTNTLNSWIIEPQISYNKKIGGGTVDVLLGSTFQESKQLLITQIASGFNNDEMIENMTAGTTKNISEYQPTLYRYSAVYGRIGYNLDDKYVINITGRRDGSSRFGPGKRFGAFGAVGFAWIFQREKFIKENLGILSTGKLRTSYGSSGNDRFPDYKYLSTYSSSTTSYQGFTGLGPTELANPFYSWERVNKFEVGIDLGFFEDKFMFNSSWYRHRTNNQLVGYNLPDLTGFPSITANLPAVVQNSGLEFEIDATVVKNKSVKWSTNLNLSIPKNKLVSYPNIEGSSYVTAFKVGAPLSIVYRYEYTGLDSQTKNYTFKDFNGDGQITSSFDRTFIFNGPRYFGTWNNSLSFNRFQMDVQLIYVNQIGQDALFYSMPGTMPSGLGNQIKSVLGMNDMQPFSQNFASKVGTAYALFTSSSGAYSDASYLRVRNASVSWSIPEKWLAKYINGGKIYVQGQNLLTLTKYKGNDPETQSLFRLPPIKMIVLGLKFNL
jgi:TonB-linked SusC/RagA family outer membrane protein